MQVDALFGKFVLSKESDKEEIESLLMFRSFVAIVVVFGQHADMQFPSAHGRPAGLRGMRARAPGS